MRAQIESEEDVAAKDAEVIAEAEQKKTLESAGILAKFSHRIGLAEDAATASGIDTQSAKLKMFVLSAVLAALGGVFLTHFNGGVGPSEASIMKSVRMVSIVAIGGMANLWGSLVMGVLLNVLSLRGTFGSYDDAVFGCILLGIMLFSPQGLLRADLVGPLGALLRRPLRRAKGQAP